MGRVVQHPATPIQAGAEARFERLARLEPDLGLGLRQGLAQRALQCVRGLGCRLHRAAGKVQQRDRHPAGLGRRLLTRVGVQLATRIHLVEQAWQQLRGQCLGGRRAKTDRAGDAARTDGNPVMRPTGRQVEHVAGLQHKFVVGLEVVDDLQRHVITQHRIALSADAPAAPAGELDQEHVVGIEMRADAAAVARHRQHQVIEPCIRHEAEPVQQFACFGQMLVQPLHQQGPAWLAHRREPRDRALLELPLAVERGDEAALHIVLGRQRRQRFERCGRHRVREGLAHQQRLLLPVLVHELGRAHAPQHRGREINVHAGIVPMAACENPAHASDPPLCRLPALETRRCPGPAHRRVGRADGVSARRR
mmetsp:Transcript_21382/g.82847  ORF Transcript_21382/g.82847 Transcript_21382/m.82847 type:complete len:365 (+) Transcript_21382:4085-5179(+)